MVLGSDGLFDNLFVDEVVAFVRKGPLDAAVDALVGHHCDAAITGGIDRNMGVNSFVKFCKIGALSATGTRPFGDGADGFVDPATMMELYSNDTVLLVASGASGAAAVDDDPEALASLELAVEAARGRGVGNDSACRCHRRRQRRVADGLGH